jgi:hypothetical protein
MNWRDRVARAAQQAQREAEQRYPVRVRIAVPPDGLGSQLTQMHAWDTGGAYHGERIAGQGQFAG